jgi:2-keto-4-pentenoate hydratase
VGSAKRLAGAIAEAHRTGVLLDSGCTAHLDLKEAYAVQEAGLARRIAAGEVLVGWKIGYTSAAMREQMGVDVPNFGPLTDKMVLASGQSVGFGLWQPRVEPEVLVVLGQDVPPSSSRAQVAASVREVRAALEVVDSVWRDYRFRLEDNTADGSSAAHVVVGPILPKGADLASIEVTLQVQDGRELRATPKEAMGHPFEAVRWLAAALRSSGRCLRAGDLVLTGGLTAAVPLREGDVVSARFGGGAEVAVHHVSGLNDLSTRPCPERRP